VIIRLNWRMSLSRFIVLAKIVESSGSLEYLFVLSLMKHLKTIFGDEGFLSDKMVIYNIISVLQKAGYVRIDEEKFIYATDSGLEFYSKFSDLINIPLYISSEKNTKDHMNISITKAPLIESNPSQPIEIKSKQVKIQKPKKIISVENQNQEILLTEIEAIKSFTSYLADALKAVNIKSTKENMVAAIKQLYQNWLVEIKSSEFDGAFPEKSCKNFLNWLKVDSSVLYDDQLGVIEESLEQCWKEMYSG